MRAMYAGAALQMSNEKCHIDMLGLYSFPGAVTFIEGLALWLLAGLRGDLLGHCQAAAGHRSR